MLINQTSTKLQEMRLLGMAKAFDEQLAMPDIAHMSFEDRFGLIVDREDSERRNRRFQSRIKRAKPKESACIEDIEFSPLRGLSKSTMLSFSSCDWVRSNQNIIISGPTGVGKTYIACALLHSACKAGYTARYIRVPRMIRSMATAKLDGSYDKFMAELARTDVVLFDDFGLSKMGAEDSRDLLEIMEDRYAVRSSLITSQLEPEKWYELIGDPTIADALLDRIVHRSHKLKLGGQSMRKKNAEIDSPKV
jgi:DNA replication protein DnaC